MKFTPFSAICISIIVGSTSIYYMNMNNITTKINNKDKLYTLNTTQVNTTKNYTINQIDENPNSHIFEITMPYYDMLKLGIIEGCEGGVALSCLQYKGYAKGYTLKEFYRQMPHAKAGDINPHHGFIGSEYKKAGGTQTIYSDALAPYMQSIGNVELTNGYTTKQLVNELKKGNPSVVWVTTSRCSPPIMKEFPWGLAVRNSHCLALIGYNDLTGAYKVLDSGGHRGSYWVSKERFETAYNKMKYAITVY